MRMYVTETTKFEKSKTSVERFIFGDDCVHSLNRGYLFALGLIYESSNSIFPKDTFVMTVDSDGYNDKILSVKYTITIK